ncbi:MAG: type II toxin-antitoxin system RelE/ParE family toxin [Chloroflexi bacterium]|nr:type II toxin-antitoxin system RelE/ParE family toxin [Chloroflexota bacterium]
MYFVQLGKQPTKALRKMSPKDARRIVAKLEHVAKDPYATNNNVTTLQNRPGYRLRVGDWRIIYKIHNNKLVIMVVKIAQRGEVYK